MVLIELNNRICIICGVSIVNLHHSSSGIPWLNRMVCLVVIYERYLKYTGFNDFLKILGYFGP